MHHKPRGPFHCMSAVVWSGFEWWFWRFVLLHSMGGIAICRLIMNLIIVLPSLSFLVSSWSSLVQPAVAHFYKVTQRVWYLVHWLGFCTILSCTLLIVPDFRMCTRQNWAECGATQTKSTQLSFRPDGAPCMLYFVDAHHHIAETLCRAKFAVTRGMRRQYPTVAED